MNFTCRERIAALFERAELEQARAVGTLAQQDALHVFPNPTGEMLTLTWPQNQAPSAVNVVPIEGQTVWRQDTPQGGRTELDTQGWEAGAYLVRMRTASGLRTTRVVKL